MEEQRHFPVFVSGLSGSGTSLLAGLLYQHCDFDHVEFESDLNRHLDHRVKMLHSGRYASLNEYRRALALDPDLGASSLREEKIRLYRHKSRRILFKSLFGAKVIRVLDKSANCHLVRSRQLKAAFPASKFVIIYRDPVENIEGWIRKWKMFREAGLDALCELYAYLYKTFIHDTRDFSEDVTIVHYRQLVSESESCVDALAAFCAVPRRKHVKSLNRLKNTPNKQAKGLRNVDSRGRIIVDMGRAEDHEYALSAVQENVVGERLGYLESHLKDRIRFI